MEKKKKVLLDEITTNNGKQLDHILGKEKAGVVTFTTAFFNFISDHKTITMRLGDEHKEPHMVSLEGSKSSPKPTKEKEVSKRKVMLPSSDTSHSIPQKRRRSKRS